MTVLNDLLETAWMHLHQSAEVKDAGFRIAQAASVGLGGAPRVRTVVLRGVDIPARAVRFHTDIRSPKVEELRQNPAVSLIAYDREGGRQIRLEGAATLVHADEAAHGYWQSSHQRSLIYYRTPYPPGSTLSAANQADVTDTMREPPAPDSGFENFCAVVISVHRLDWLDLAASGHRRAVFDRVGDVWRGAWVAP